MQPKVTRFKVYIIILSLSVQESNVVVVMEVISGDNLDTGPIL